MVFNNISKEDGLPHDLINDVVKDKLGFIWFASNDGLCRYDAHDKIRIFKEGDKNISDGLKSSYIKDLHVGQENILYIGTGQGGLTLYDIENDSWQTFVNDPDDPQSISNDDVLSILEDSEKRIWVGTENGLNLFDKTNKTFTRFMPEPEIEGKLHSKAVLSITEDNNGWIWIGTWEGGFYLATINEQNNDVSFRKFVAKSGGREVKSFWDIYHDKHNNYWLASHYGGLYLMTLPDNANDTSTDWEPSFYQYSQADDSEIPAYFISDIVQDPEGNLWLSTVDGLSIIPSENINIHFNQDLYEKPNLSFKNHHYNPSKPTSIIGDVLTSLFLDQDGIIWIASKSGVSRCNPLSNQLKDFQLAENNKIVQNTQNYFITKNGKVWIACYTPSIIEYDPMTNESNPILQELLKHDHLINSIYSKDGVLLYMATDKCIIQYNLDNKVSKRYLFERNAKINVKESPVKYLLEDHNSNLWLCTENGLIKLNLIDEKFSYFQNDLSDPNSIVDNSVTQIIQTKKGELWISTFNGLSQIVEENEKVKFINYKASGIEESLKSNRLTSLISIDNTLYIGSDGGLIGYNLDTNKFLDFTDGNQKLFINSLQTDGNNKIWGSSTSNLFKFDPVSETMLSLDNKDGISNSNYMSLASVKGPDGNLYFGHFYGFTKVDPLNYVINTSPPEVAITEVNILSKNKIEQRNILQKKSIELEPDHYTINIDFASLEYTRPDKMQFAYLLEGFDQDWKHLNKGASATYTNLDHGKYTFKVKAVNEAGVWSDKNASLNIKVNPELLETTWIQGLILLLSLLLIYMCIKIYTKAIKKRNEELKNYNDSLNKEIKQRTEIEKELQCTNEELKRSNSELEQFAYIASHDLQEPLRITGSFIDLLGSRYNDVLDEDAHKYIDFAKGGIGRMGLLIKNLLTFSKVGGTVLDFQKTSLKLIVEEKLLDLARLINEKNATIKFDDLPEIYCEKNQMSMLFYNLINNALKFNDSPNPVINISSKVSDSKDHYTFYVSDNGIGIDPLNQDKIFDIFKRLHDRDAYEGTGIGLALCKKIVTRHGGKIWVVSKLGKGTTFNFSISKNLGSSELTQITKENVTI